MVVYTKKTGPHTRIIDGGSGYLCEMEPVAHFGLGKSVLTDGVTVTGIKHNYFGVVGCLSNHMCSLSGLQDSFLDLLSLLINLLIIVYD